MRMTYCTADIHGDYEAYQRLLDAISLRDEDTLFVLGDVVDRGPDGVKILQDMMMRVNVLPILGNHEYLASYAMQFINEEITDELLARLDETAIQAIKDWFLNGGNTTFREMAALSQEDRDDVLDYLKEFTLYEELTVKGQKYLLTHAGIQNFSPEKPLEDYHPADFFHGRPDYGTPYWPDVIVVSGHTPTEKIPGNPHPGRIYRTPGHIAIDCGCACRCWWPA